MGRSHNVMNNVLLLVALWMMICALVRDTNAASIEKRKVFTETGDWGQILTPVMIGGGYGDIHQDCPMFFQRNGVLVKKLEIWSDGNTLQALQTSFTDGSQSARGKRNGNPNGTLDLAPGEQISYLEIWLNDGNIDADTSNTRAVRVQMSTSLGQTLDVGSKNGDYASKELGVGGGILVGSRVIVGTEIVAMGFQFLRSPILSVEMTDLSYPPGIIDSSTGITDRKLDDLQQVRDEDDPDTYNWTFSGATQITQSHTVTSSTTSTFGISESIEVGGEFLGIGAKSTTGFTWEKSEQSTESSEDTLSYTETWGQSGTLDRGQGVHIQASVAVGKVSLPYNATVTVTLEDGKAWTYADTGIYKNVGYSSVYVTRKIFNVTTGEVLEKTVRKAGKRH